MIDYERYIWRKPVGVEPFRGEVLSQLTDSTYIPIVPNDRKLGIPSHAGQKQKVALEELEETMKRKLFNSALVASAMALIATTAPAADKSAALTKDQAAQILQQLKDLSAKVDKIQTGGRPPVGGQKAKISIDQRYVLGSKSAPLTLVEFTDYQCPFCARWHNSTFSDIKTNWIDTGKLRFAVRDNPLPMHPNAMISAEAAHCAGAQGQFWTLGEKLTLNPDRLNIDQFLSWMGELQTDASAFKTCMDDHAYKSDIDADMLQASKIGLTGTPAFVIGKSTPDGVDGETVMGALPYPVFEARLKDLSRVH